MLYFDTNRIYCMYCKHLWILASDEAIDEDLIGQWFKETLLEHEFVHQKWEEEHEEEI